MIKSSILITVVLLITVSAFADEVLTAVSSNPQRAARELSDVIESHFIEKRFKTLSGITLINDAVKKYSFPYKKPIPDNLITITKKEDKESYTAQASADSIFDLNIKDKSHKYFLSAREKLTSADDYVQNNEYYNGLIQYIHALDLSLSSYDTKSDSIVIFSLGNIEKIMSTIQIHGPEGRLTFTEPEQAIRFRIYFAAEVEFSLKGIPLELSYKDVKKRYYTDENGYIEIAPRIPNGETRFYYMPHIPWRILNNIKLSQKSIIMGVLSELSRTSGNDFSIVLLGERKLFVESGLPSDFSNALTGMGYTIVNGKEEADFIFDLSIKTIEKGEGQYGGFYALVLAEASITDKHGKKISIWGSRKFERYSETSVSDAVQNAQSPAITNLLGKMKSL